jgi:hypothetical protein
MRPKHALSSRVHQAASPHRAAVHRRLHNLATELQEATEVPHAAGASCAPRSSTGDMSLGNYLLPQLYKSESLTLNLVKPLLLWLRASASSTTSADWLRRSSIVGVAHRLALTCKMEGLHVIPCIPAAQAVSVIGCLASAYLWASC